MKSSGRGYLIIAAIIAGALVFAAPAMAAQVAKVTSFDGDVVILQGEKIVTVTQVGQVVMAGDRIQTQQGTAQLTFQDGAVMKVNEFTTAMVQERDEESGFAFWKKKEPVRRITAFVGKIWFKSGASEKKNFLQTPTAVCGLRGTDGEIGFDNLNTYLTMYSGQAEVVGNVIRAAFAGMTPAQAMQSPVFKALQDAYNAQQAAETTGDAVVQAQATVKALEVVKQAAEVLKSNPDATVSQRDGQMAAAVADAGIAAAGAKVEVAKIEATAKAATEQAQAARQTGDTAKAQAADKAAADADTQKAAAKAAADAAAAAAAQANAAAQAQNLAAAQQAAQRAQAAEQNAVRATASAQQSAQNAGVNTTVAPTTVSTTVIAESTVAATTTESTAATTTVEPTTTSTSTSSTTTTSAETTVSPAQ